MTRGASRERFALVHSGKAGKRCRCVGRVAAAGGLCAAIDPRKTSCRGLSVIAAPAASAGLL